jgi:hypothetical protein
MEESDVIRGYAPTLDYELAGFPFRVLFVCTAGISEREGLVTRAPGTNGVVSVQEIMSGRRNVHVQAVAPSNEGFTQIARALDELGLEVLDEVLVRDEYSQPSARFEAFREEQPSTDFGIRTQTTFSRPIPNGKVHQGYSERPSTSKLECS